MRVTNSDDFPTVNRSLVVPFSEALGLYMLARTLRKLADADGVLGEGESLNPQWLRECVHSLNGLLLQLWPSLYVDELGESKGGATP